MFSTKAETLVQDYNKVFDELVEEFHDRAAGDTLVVVHRIWKDFAPKIDSLRAPFSNYSLSRLPHI